MEKKDIQQLNTTTLLQAPDFLYINLQLFPTSQIDAIFRVKYGPYPTYSFVK